MSSGDHLNKNRTDVKTSDLKSLLSLTNKYYNLDPKETHNAASAEMKHKTTVVHKAQGAAVKSALKTHIDTDDIRTVTKVSPISRPDAASFEKKRMRFWVKISAVFSSKRKMK
jgi:hypothetical protein